MFSSFTVINGVYSFIPLPVLEGFMDESERYLLQKRLSEIQTKLLVVWGKHDRVSCCNYFCVLIYVKFLSIFDDFPFRILTLILKPQK